MAKALVAYFSHTGENYFGGAIREIAVGNTEKVAKFVAKAADADIVRLETVKSYPENYKACTDEAMREMKAGERPVLKAMPDVSSYDVIYLGYPSWWGTMPMALFTFLESADFTGKTICPFCTNEGSGLGNSLRDIREAAPGALVAEGLSVRGSDAASSEEAVKAWVKGR